MAITKRFDFICIGSGPAGPRAAVQAAKLGQRVCVIEKHPVIGGSGLNPGTISSKTFREAVLSLKLSNRGRVQSNYPSMSPPTMGELLDKVRLQVTLESQIIEKQLARNGITLIRGRLSETVERLELSPGPPKRVMIHLQSGKRHVSELVFFSVGRLGATASLQLEAAGLEADTRWG